MISAKLGHILDTPLSPIAKRIPLSPNFLTITGFIITTISALIIPENLRLGGILIIIGGLFDFLDGLVARTQGKVSKFGAFLDSLLDRYADALLFIAISWYFTKNGNPTGLYLSLGSLVGSLLISYARARAEGLGKSCQTGILERPERIILLSFATITGWLIPVLWIIFIFTHLTVIQRVYHVWKVMRI